MFDFKTNGQYVKNVAKKAENIRTLVGNSSGGGNHHRQIITGAIKMTALEIKNSFERLIIKFDTTKEESVNLKTSIRN